jgi:uncharacterized protein with HEPN domain
MAELSKHDRNILQHIQEYCILLEKSIARFGNSFDTFISDRDYYQSVAMSVYQMSELTNSLTTEFKMNSRNIPWKEIRGMRNIIAHSYDNLDDKIIWKTAIVDSPTLKEFCIAEIEKDDKAKQKPDDEIDFDDDDLEL